MTKNESKMDFLHKISEYFVCIFQILQFFSEKQFRKSFVIIVTMEYQNVQASVNFSHMKKGPGMHPGLCNRPILFVSSRLTPCICAFYYICTICRVHRYIFIICTVTLEPHRNMLKLSLGL